GGFEGADPMHGQGRGAAVVFRRSAACGRGDWKASVQILEELRPRRQIDEPDGLCVGSARGQRQDHRLIRLRDQAHFVDQHLPLAGVAGEDARGAHTFNRLREDAHGTS
ncbi:hypothetical protein AB4084_30315, partial [Lysobacter sp. 2RAB21]